MKKILLAVFLLSVGGCATTDPATPNPCTRSDFVQLQERDVDSLSEREFQRLRDLQRSCDEYRMVREMDRTNKMGGPVAAGAIGLGAITLLTVLALVFAP